MAELNLDGPEQSLLTVVDVADLLRCSARHVTRLSEAGKMPAPRRLGRLLRWYRAELEQWLGAGCPDVGETGWKFTPKLEGGEE